MTELPPAVAKYIADAEPFVRGTNKAVEQAQKFTRSAEKSALSARKMGIEARQAGEKAAIAGKAAAEGAEKAAKGLIKEAAAAELAAKAVRELERAELKQAAAAIAMREANDKSAKAHAANATMVRSLARDTESAGGVMVRAMRSAASAVSGAADAVAESGPLMGTAVVAGIGLVPVAATAAAGVVTASLGASLIGLGLYASKGSEEAKAAIARLKAAAKAEATKVGQPFEKVWTTIADVAEREMARLGPVVRGDLADLAPEVQAFVNQAGSSLGELEPAIDGAERAFAAMLRSLGPEMPSIMASLASAITAVTDAIEDNPEAIPSMVKGLAALLHVAGETVGALTRLTGKMNEANVLWGGVTVAAMENGRQVGQVTTITTQLGGATTGTAAAQRQLNSAMRSGKTTADELKTALDALTGAHQSADQAEIAYKNAIAAGTRGLKEHGRGLDLNTQKGRDNYQSLISVAQAAQTHIASMRADGASMIATNRQAGAARAGFIRLATQMGASAGEAKALADRLLGIKSRKVTMTTVFVTVHKGDGSTRRNPGTSREFHADGGLITGPGTGTSDSIPAWLSNREYVVNAKSTAKHLPLLEAINAGRYAAGGLVGYARGGQVSVGGVNVSAAQWRSLGVTLGKDFMKAMTGSTAEISSMDRRLERTIARLFGGKKTSLDNKLIAYLDRNSAKLQDLSERRALAKEGLKEGREYAKTLTGNARSFAGLSGLAAPTSATQIRQGLQMRLGDLTRYAGIIKALNKRGLSKSLLKQVLDMGPEEGIKYGEMLLGASKGVFSDINAVQKQIDRASTAFGRSGADALYDAGRNAGKGFLTGLSGELKSLDKTMDRLAKRMASSLKRALKIKSPSRLTEPDGRQVVAGIALGMDRGLPVLDRSSQRIAARLTRGAATGPRVASALMSAAVHRTPTPSASAQPIELRVYLDGREIQANIQTRTLRYNRRNTSNGLTVSS